MTESYLDFMIVYEFVYKCIYHDAIVISTYYAAQYCLTKCFVIAKNAKEEKKTE